MINICKKLTNFSLPADCVAGFPLCFSLTQCYAHTHFMKAKSKNCLKIIGFCRHPPLLEHLEKSLLNSSVERIGGKECLKDLKHFLNFNLGLSLQVLRAVKKAVLSHVLQRIALQYIISAKIVFVFNPKSFVFLKIS